MKKENLVIDEGIKSCAFCNELAELMCGKCEETFYCKPEHQKMDWRRHSSHCKSIADKRKEHLEYKRTRKTQIFKDLSQSKQNTKKAIETAEDLIDREKTFMAKYSTFDMQLQIQLGSTVCVDIRLLIASKEFSVAQDILNVYFKEKNTFLSDISNINSKEELEEMEPIVKQRQLYLISGKLKLISTLANLRHELIRNSVDMFQILIEHVQKVYGVDSLELSNVYFYTANYLHFLNQNNKALACYLKSGKMRKEKGGTAYYNVALLLLKAGRKKTALDFFQKALELIQKQNNKENSYIIPQIYENIALIYLGEGMSRPMVDYFQKAYFFYMRNKKKAKAEVIMQLFMLIKKESKEEGSEDMKMIEFSKEKKEKRTLDHISSKNKDKFWNADKVTEEDHRKKIQWMVSFKEMKLNYNEGSPFKPPQEIQYLFGTDMRRHGEEEDQHLIPSQSNRLGMSEGINMDINFMRTLTSNQVGYLHELNRLLMECKESAAYFDIVENSNFYQAVNRDKLNGFYRLNPRLVRPTDLDRRLMLQVTKEEEFQDEEEYYDYVQPIQNPVLKTPKLDLSKLKPSKF